IGSGGAGTSAAAAARGGPAAAVAARTSPCPAKVSNIESGAHPQTIRAKRMTHTPRGRGVGGVSSGPAWPAHGVDDSSTVLLRDLHASCEERVHGRERLAQVLLAVGVRETQVALALAAERGARQAGDAGFFEQEPGQLVAPEPGPLDVRERVERPVRQRAGDA